MTKKAHAYSLLSGAVHGLDYDHDPKGGKHMQIFVIENDVPHRIALNVHSAKQPDELLFHMADPFDHPIVDDLKELDEGHYDLLSPLFDTLRLDYVRGGFGLSRDRMNVLPFTDPSPAGTLKSVLEPLFQTAMQENHEWRIHAFGEPWGPEPRRRDRYFGFVPGRGIHDVHMNQGGTGRHLNDNRERQDGAIILRKPGGAWAALFLAFQTQIWPDLEDETAPSAMPTLVPK